METGSFYVIFNQINSTLGAMDNGLSKTPEEYEQRFNLVKKCQSLLQQQISGNPNSDVSKIY